MAARKPNPVVTVERDGIEVRVDTSYARTWEGVHQLKRMRDESIPDAERFFEVVDYYDRVVVNAEEVASALGTSDANAIYEFLGECVKEATPKNS